MHFRSLTLLISLAIGCGSFLGPCRAETTDVATTDADYSVQGEYVGDQVGMQVVALGDGDFDLVIYEGGLPGAGAKPIKPRTIEGDADVVADLIDSMKLTKTTRQSSTLGAKPPAASTVLFDGTAKSLADNWESGRLNEDGTLGQGTMTKATFVDYSLHLEFRTPWMPEARGQARGNSGVYQQGRYETQVLDSFGLEGLSNETGGIYEVNAPAVNACFPPLTWQTYDVDFTAAKFDDSGKKIADAKMTVRLNGIMVQNDVAVPKATRAAKFEEGPTSGPIYLQDHGNPVSYRNIWIVPRDSVKDARRPIVPGFERFYPSSSEPSIDGGELLISNLACDACHASQQPRMLPRQLGPDLTELVGRARLDAIVAMIKNPHDVKPGTTMPDPWPGLDESARDLRATAITNYLIAGGKGKLIDRASNKAMAERGSKLYHSVGCVACHTSFEGAATAASTSVPLGQIYRKYSLVSLAQFLQNPHAVRPGLRMPALVGSVDEAYAIAAYLTRDVTLRESKGEFRRTIYRGHWEKLPDFKLLEAGASDVVDELRIDDIRPKNDYAVVFEASLPISYDGEYQFKLSSDDGSVFQIADNRLENDFIHPETTAQATFKLAAGVYPIRIEFFDGGGKSKLKLEMVDPRFGSSDIALLIADSNQTESDFLPSDFKFDESLVEQGHEWFMESGCTTCHAFPRNNATVWASLSFKDLQSNRGCLSDHVKRPAVDYELNSAQRMAITAAIQARQNHSGPTQTTGDVSDESRIHLTMAALNCYACHERGKIGGPDSTRDAIFQTTTPEMGLEGRLPPPLDGVGDKLNDTYFASAIQKGANLRDYMLTRMPAFGYEPLRAFHQSINAIDRRNELRPVVNKDSLHGIITAGRQAVGEKGLACIKCHSYGGENPGGLGAIDMLDMTTRLRVEWFHRYLKDPTGYRPGTRMPNSFVEGKSALASLYDGDPDRQIDAMWTYLGQGKQAKEPEGLKQGAIILVADKKPRIFRNFFSNLSGRGIAVGYPNGQNLIWDAESMTLARSWRNSFIDASLHWVGRGQGRQDPLGDAVIEIESKTPFALLEKIDADWPTQSGRDRGFRFHGYRLDKSGNPTFMYSIGDTTITDTPMPAPDGNGQWVRQIVVDRSGSDTEDPLVWQPVVGSVNESGENYRVNEKFDVIVDGVDCQILSTGDVQSLRAVIPPHAETTITETIRW